VAAILATDSAAEEVEPVARGAEVIRVSDKAFRTISSTETSQGVLALVEPPAQNIDDVFRDPLLVVVLDGIQDPGNAGAILRVAEAFGASGVVLLKGCVNPYNPKAVRASAGSLFRLPVISGVSAETILETVRNRRMALFAAMPRADKLVAEAEFTRPVAIVLGSEGRGVSPALSEAAEGVRIPTRSVESLNAAVAAGVLLYEASRQRAA
jgi:TrmH family RNA methyltransferase